MNPSCKDRQIAFRLGLEFAPPAAHPVPTGRLIPAATVREIFGGISDMTLWRWMKDESLGFPKPIVLARNRYWREAEVQAWIDQRAAKQAAVPAT